MLFPVSLRKRAARCRNGNICVCKKASLRRRSETETNDFSRLPLRERIVEDRCWGTVREGIRKETTPSRENFPRKNAEPPLSPLDKTRKGGTFHETDTVSSLSPTSEGHDCDTGEVPSEQSRLTLGPFLVSPKEEEGPQCFLRRSSPEDSLRELLVVYS